MLVDNYPAQSLPRDRELIAGIIECFPHRYNYLEIGVYYGGSLYPHLLSNKCKRATGVDLFARREYQDERGSTKYSISEQKLKNVLKEHNIPTNKLTLITGTSRSISEKEKYDLAMIDAEHTNWAVFLDAIRILPAMTKNSIMLFHDTTLVHGAIDSFCAYLFAQNIVFRIYKLKGSEIAAIVLGDIPEVIDYLRENEGDYEEFKIGAKIRLGEMLTKTYEKDLDRIKQR